jgi:ribonuclease G
MSEEILINVSKRETRVAVVENGILQELAIERENRRGIVGNIYKGKVSRVLPGMQAAFVNIGLKRAAFLHSSDIVPFAEGELEPPEQVEEDITQLLHEGQEILVQVVKDPLGTKGARLTTRLSLPSRYLVFMPELTRYGISKRIEDAQERARLIELLSQSEISPTDGFIIRTNAEGVADVDFAADIIFLRKLWVVVQERAKKAACGDIIFEDLPLCIRALRDQVGLSIERVRVDDKLSFHRIEDFVKEFMPSLIGKIEYFDYKKPIFDLYGIEDEIYKALNQKVPLKSGGYLIIEQTEAMATIDVNTGGFVGSRNLDETIFKTNLEAAQTIARQLRLRNLGGIIIIDFIDMTHDDHKKQVYRTLEKALERDPVKTTLTDFSALGLIEMTRKRTHESLQHILCEPCGVCQGSGYIKRVETICYDIFREIERNVNAYEPRGYIILANQSVIDHILDEESTAITDLEAITGSQIKLQVETFYTQDQFDVVMV